MDKQVLQTMQACQVDTKTGFLSLSAMPIPTPGDGQLLVKVKAFGLNRADLLQRAGNYPPPPGESPILGLELSGEVVAVGDKVHQFSKGDSIFALVGGGAYAEYCLVEQSLAIDLPNNLSFIQGAALAEALFTANEILFEHGRLQPGQQVLIHAGASGIGTMAIQMAKHINAKVITTVGSQEKINFVKKLGADTAYNYHEQNWVELIKPQSVDLVIDFIGKKYLPSHLKVLKSHGRLIQTACMSGAKAEINLALLMQKRLTLKGFTLRSQTLAQKQSIAKRVQKNWLPPLSKQEITPIIDSSYPFTQIEQAHQKMKLNQNIGKIIIEI